jgi:hypothetical protein
MKDFLGRDIVAGNDVVYPVRRGSSMWLSRMKVLSTEGGKLRGNNPEGRQIQLTNLENIVVVDVPKPAAVAEAAK